MKKLLASDIDGTLVYYGKLSCEDKNSILKLRSQGHFFGVSTGRPYNGVKFLKQEYDLDIDFYVLLNGALILDENLEVLKHERIDFETVKHIFSKYNNPKGFAVDTGYISNILIGYVDAYPHSNKIRDIKELKDEWCSLISMDYSNLDLGLVEKLCNDINEEFKDVHAYRNSYYIDVVPLGCSKGNGVKMISQKFLVDMENVHTIGDSFNDLSMFEITENSYTFDHVEEKLKHKTKFIVKSVGDCVDNYILR